MTDLPVLRKERGKLFLCLRKRLPRRFVEQGKLIGFAEQVKMLALPVHVHEIGRDLAEHGRIDAAPVHLDDAAAVRRVFSENDDLFIGIDFKFLQHLKDRVVFQRKKNGLNAAFFFPVADHRFVRLGAENEVDAVQDHRFSRTRFTGKDVQPLSEFYFRALDQRNVFDRQSAKHITLKIR